MNLCTFCKRFRMDVLHKTLKEMSEENNVNLKTLSAFENRRYKNNNVKYISYYLNSCNEEQKEQFKRGVSECL